MVFFICFIFEMLFSCYVVLLNNCLLFCIFTDDMTLLVCNAILWGFSEDVDDTFVTVF